MDNVVREESVNSDCYSFFELPINALICSKNVCVLRITLHSSLFIRNDKFFILVSTFRSSSILKLLNIKFVVIIPL